MANYTQNYQLHQWVPEDNFLRTDFNEDFEKIDTAIKSTETGLQARVDGETARLNGEVSRLDGAIATAQQTVQSNLDTQVARLDGALASAQQTLRNEYNGGFQNVNGTLAAIQQSLGQKLELVNGSFAGTAAINTMTEQIITLGFQPRTVIIGAVPFNYDSSLGFGVNCLVIYPGLICTGASSMHKTELEIISTGFRIAGHANLTGYSYQYLAIR